MAPLRVPAREPVYRSALIRWDDEFRALRSALQTLAQNMPDRFAIETLAQIMSSAMYFWLRLNLELERRIRESDEENRLRYEARLSEGVVNALMPRLFKLGEYIAEMAQSQAATTRQWALTREKLARAEDAASQPAKKKRQRRRRRPSRRQ